MTPFAQLGQLNKQAGIGSILASAIEHAPGAFRGLGKGVGTGIGDIATGARGLFNGALKGLNDSAMLRPLSRTKSHEIGRMLPFIIPTSAATGGIIYHNHDESPTNPNTKEMPLGYHGTQANPLHPGTSLQDKLKNMGKGLNQGIAQMGKDFVTFGTPENNLLLM